MMLKMDDIKNTIILGDSFDILKSIADKSVHCIVTSPPYWALRDYGLEPTKWPECEFNLGFGIVNKIPSWTGCFGLEPNPETYIAHLVLIFNECKRVLRDDGTLWLNLGDSYWGSGNASGHNEKTKNLGATTKSYGATKGHSQKKSNNFKSKDLIGIPWMAAFALRAAGWFLRQDIIWAKSISGAVSMGTCMPESIVDRNTKAHEYFFLLSKAQKYYYDAEAIKQEPSESFKKDTRFKTGSTSNNIKSGYDDAKAQNPKLPHSVFKNGVAQKSNKRSVWASENNYDIWQWLFANAPEEVINPLWEQFKADSVTKKTVWFVNPSPYKEAHFATYGEDLIKDCIKAGTSEHGCCADCGAPYERILEKKKGIPPSHKGSSFNKGKTGETIVPNNGKPGNGERTVTIKTIGWQKTCKCETNKIVRPIVLDPFGGSGTTGLVSEKLGCDYVIIEKNPRYKKMAENRIRTEMGMFTHKTESSSITEIERPSSQLKIEI